MVGTAPWCNCMNTNMCCNCSLDDTRRTGAASTGEVYGRAAEKSIIRLQEMMRMDLLMLMEEESQC